MTWTAVIVIEHCKSWTDKEYQILVTWMFGRHSTWQELDIRDMIVCGRRWIFVTWMSGCHSTWHEMDIRVMDVRSPQHMAGVVYS